MTGTTRAIDAWPAVLAVLCVAASGCGKGAVVDHKSTSLTSIVDTLRSAERLNRSTIEVAIGAPLAQTSENGSFTFFEGHDVTLSDATIGLVDYREPRAGGNATAGALLTLTLTRGCPARAQVEHRYGPLSVAGVPRGRSLDEETQLARPEPWGRLSFGFAERTPTCLTSITFSHDR